MGTFDTIVRGVSAYLSDDGDGDGASGDGGGFGGFVSSLFDDSEGGDGEGGGGGGFGGFVSSLFDDSEEGAGEDSGGGGWGGTFGRIVDRLSGDGGREDLWDRALGTVADRVSQYLPEELREVAGQYLHQGQGGQGSSWAGSLVDPNQTRVPNGWHAVANHPTVGHSYGESGFGGFVDHSIANLAGNHGMQSGYVMSPQSPQPQMGNGQPYDDGIRYIRAPDIDPGQPLGHAGSGDPRVTMPAGALDGARYVDTDGDGYADRIYPQPGSSPRQGDGEDYGTEPDGYIPGARDADADGRPDVVDPIGGADIEHGGSLGRPAPGSTYDDRADYDDMVTSGAGPSEPRYQVPDDPTFPADDPAPAAVSAPAPMPAEPPVVEAPASDFQQSIDDANQVDQSMDGMFDGVEGA